MQFFRKLFGIVIAFCGISNSVECTLDSTKLQQAFDGTKPLYAITVTRTGSAVLTPVEIHVVFSVLRELFCGHDENYAQNLYETIQSVGKNYIVRYEDPLDYSFLKTSNMFARSSDKEKIFEELKSKIVSAEKEYNSKQDILNDIRQNIQLIVFNEYFFGRRDAFVDDYLERQIEPYSKQLANAILVLNYLRQEYNRITLFELDRSATIIYNSLLLNDLTQLVKPPDLLPQKSGSFMTFFNPEYSKLIKYSKLISQYVYSNVTPQVEANQLYEYFSYLKQKVQQAEFFQIFEPILENRTVYLWQNIELMSYNKDTYFDEAKTLSLKDDLSYVYRFGCGVDLLSEDTELARVLYQNISTEICRDLFCGIRSNSPFKKIHIIQSNTIDPEGEKCKKNIPPCDFIIHADPRTKGKVYRKNTDTMIEQCSIFDYEFDILANHYTIRIFKIMFERQQ